LRKSNQQSLSGAQLAWMVRHPHHLQKFVWTKALGEHMYADYCFYEVWAILWTVTPKNTWRLSSVHAVYEEHGSPKWSFESAALSQIRYR